MTEHKEMTEREAELIKELENLYNELGEMRERIYQLVLRLTD